ncbi:hypothetical protein JXA02_10430, partial [candidate division KSB1 bacterium]|nr:hypothetical protein [candidate division KSB1 bacterium]
LKWRNHRHAGIESITNIYPDDYGPIELRKILSKKLSGLRRAHGCAALSLEQPREVSLRYVEAARGRA